MHPVTLSNWKKKLKEDGAKVEVQTLPELGTVIDGRFRYYNHRRRPPPDPKPAARDLPCERAGPTQTYLLDSSTA